MLQGLFLIGMAAAALDDLWRRRVGNVVTLPLVAGGVAVAAQHGAAALAASVGAAFVAAALLLPAFARGFVGGGDVKLVAAIGAWLGPVGGAYALAIGFVLAAAGGAIMAVRDRALGAEVVGNLRDLRRLATPPARTRLQSLPLGAALAVGAMAVACWQEWS